MAADLATLGLRLENKQAIADAERTGVALEQMGVKGEAAAGKIASSSNPVIAAIKKQQVDYTQLTARMQDFARAGANAAQVAQMTGNTLQQAAAAVKEYAGTVALAEIDVQGLKAAQAQLALANIEVATTSEIAAKAQGMKSLQLGRLNMELGTFIGRLTGTNTAVTRLAAMIGGNLLGFLPMIAALAGIAALLWVFEKLYDHVNKNRKAIEEANKALDDLMKPRGEFAVAAELKLAEEHMVKLQQRLQGTRNDLQSIATVIAANPTIGWLLFGFKAKQQAGEQDAINDQTKRLQAGWAEILRIEREGSKAERDQRVSDNIALLRYNANDSTARQALIDQRKRDLTEIQRLAKSTDDVSRSIRANLADEVGRINGALDPNKGRVSGPRSGGSTSDEYTEYVRQDNAAAEKVQALTASQEQHTAQLRSENDAMVIENEAYRRGAVAHERYSIILSAEDEIAKARLGTSKDTVDALVKEIKRNRDLKLAHLDNVDAINAEDEAREARIEKQKKAAAESTQTNKHFLNEVQNDFANFFTNILTKGITSIGDLFKQIRDMFFRLIAEMAAAKIVQKIGAVILGSAGLAGTAGAQGVGGAASGGLWNNTTYGPALRAGGSAIAGGLIGYGIGSSTGSAAMGAVGGALGGAAIGAQFGGPVGAAVGAVAGFVGGIIGAGHAAKEAKKHMQELQAQLTDSFAALRAKVSGDNTAAALAQNDSELKKFLLQINAALPGKANEAERNKERAEAATLYGQLAEQIRAQAATALANTQDDLQVRLLAAMGKDKEAELLDFQHKQERERKALVDSFGTQIDATEAATLALLDQVQAQEKLKAATDSASRSAVNVVDGYRIQAEIFRALIPRGGNVSSDRLGGGDLTVNLRMPDGKTLARVTLKDYKAAAQKQFGDSSRWSEIDNL